MVNWERFLFDQVGLSIVRIVEQDELQPSGPLRRLLCWPPRGGAAVVVVAAAAVDGPHRIGGGPGGAPRAALRPQEPLRPRAHQALPELPRRLAQQSLR